MIETMQQEFEQIVLDYFGGEDIAVSAFLSKYSNNKTETPQEMWERVVGEFARKEQENGGKALSYNEVKELLNFQCIIPQGSILASVGLPEKFSSLSNCTVLPAVPDSYGGILATDQKMAHLFKRRCGVGVDISQLRPNGSKVRNSAATSTGVVSFMHRFSNTTREVAQNGRRGALMLSIGMDHPDSMEFILIKQDLSKVTGANISVQLTDEFMKAAMNDEEYLLRFPLDMPTKAFSNLEEGWDMEYPLNKLIDLGNHNYIRKVKAKEYWDALVKCAHHTAEPGLMFKTRHDDYCPSNIYPKFKNSTSNPCSEIYMGGHDSCRLIAINLMAFVKNPFSARVSWDSLKFRKVINAATRLVDDLVDLELEAIDNIMDKIGKDPEDYEYRKAELDMWQKFRDIGREGRRAGLGFTGLGDVIAAMGLQYGEDESLELVEEIMEEKFRYELTAQIDLAIERGPFTGFDAKLELEDSQRPESWFYFVRNNYPEQWERMQKYGRRSISHSTTAPTGSISMLAKVSAGIEPVFMLYYTRRKKINPSDPDARVDFVDDSGDSWQEFPQIHPAFVAWIKAQDPTMEPKSMDMDELAFWAKRSPWKGSTAPEIDWSKRVELQSIVQKYITHSISSTINLPKDVAVEKVSEIYQKSWEMGLKGITVYRDGSRSGVMITKEEAKTDKFGDYHSPKRPEYVEATLVRFQNNKERWIAIIGLIDGRPYEIFTGLQSELDIPGSVSTGRVKKRKNGDNKNAYDFEWVDKEGKMYSNAYINRIFNKEYWNYSKLVSGLLRHGMPLEHVVATIASLDLVDGLSSWKSGIIRALKRFVADGREAKAKCHECGGKIIYEEGCEKCLECGVSKCG